MTISTLLFSGLGLALFAISFFLAALWRRVVPTNEVHIVQTKGQTISYGKDTGNGNVYYQVPTWVPLFGIEKVVLPVSVFDIELNAYEAYDKGRLPFVVDVKAFFRVSDSSTAAQRVANFSELKDQLVAVVQGAVRAILAGSDIEEIMQGRSKFGDEFTKEVKEQLTHWGVEPVKNIELMDLRDSKSSNVIHNIMEKKKSMIEMESRQEVAKNMKTAQIAEIEAKREIELNKQEAEQQVGLRTVEAKRKVDLAEEDRKQMITDQAKTTAEKAAEVLRVQKVKAAEIEKQSQIIKAEQEKTTALLKAEQDKATAILNAEASFESVNRKAEADLNKNVKDAEGLKAIGNAKAEAEKLMLLAPVEAQTRLAKEIGENKSYQEYLIQIRKVEAEQNVGIEQAKSLHQAEIKIIANTGSATSGIKSVMDIFSSQGGVQLGAMLEGLQNTDTGKALLSTLGVKEQAETKATSSATVKKQ